MNLYSYVRNNPLILIDPTGLDFEFGGKDKDKFVDDANNRKDAQFKIKLNDKGIVEIVNKDKVDVSKLSKSEKALFNAINDKENRAVLQGFGPGVSIKLEGGVAGEGGTATIDSTSVEFEAFVGNGTNIVDESDMALLRKANSKAAGEVIVHAMMESYESARTGSNDYESVHNAANSFFPAATVDKLKPESGNSNTVNNYTYNWSWGRINKTFEVSVKMSVPQERSSFKGSIKAPFGDMTKIKKVR
jgi:hypothetical protein